MNVPQLLSPEGSWIDFDQDTEEWVGHCPHCGEVSREPGEPLWHDFLVVTLVRHDADLHDGDSLVHADSFILLGGK